MVNYKLFISDAQQIEKKYGVPTSVTLAQIIQESSGKYENGLSGLAAEAKNLFGVKAFSSWKGQVYTAPTTEYENGKAVKVLGSFRKYNSYYDSIEDHAKLLLNSRYTKYTSQAGNAYDYARGVAKGGYATDPNYGETLVKLMKEYDLTKYDKGMNSKDGQTIRDGVLIKDNFASQNTNGNNNLGTAGTQIINGVKFDHNDTLDNDKINIDGTNGIMSKIMKFIIMFGIVIMIVVILSVSIKGGNVNGYKQNMES